MAKKKIKAKVVKKPVKKTKKQEVCNCCRQPSGKDKSSKVEKLKKLAKSGKHKEKSGFFGKLFGR